MSDYVAQAKAVESEIAKLTKKKGMFASLFSSTTDPADVADLYAKAANFYRLAELVPQAVECYKNAAEHYNKSSYLVFKVADCYKSAAELLIDNDSAQALELFGETAELYLKNSNYSLAAKIFSGMAQRVLQHSPEDFERAIELHKKAFRFYKEANSVFTAYSELAKAADLEVLRESFAEAKTLYFQVAKGQGNESAAKYRTPKLLLSAFLCDCCLFVNNELDELNSAFDNLVSANPYMSGAEEYRTCNRLKSIVSENDIEGLKTLQEEVRTDSAQTSMLLYLERELEKQQKDAGELNLQ